MTHIQFVGVLIVFLYAVSVVYIHDILMFIYLLFISLVAKALLFCHFEFLISRQFSHSTYMFIHDITIN